MVARRMVAIMATKPTRMQAQACDKLAEALVLVAEAARLDGGGNLDAGDLAEVARRLARASSAFDLEEILGRALDKRVRAIGLPSSAADMLSLMETELKPPAMLLLSDDDLKGLIIKLEEDLGGI
jgi:hypothetical protein